MGGGGLRLGVDGDRFVAHLLDQALHVGEQLGGCLAARRERLAFLLKAPQRLSPQREDALLGLANLHQPFDFLR